LVPQRKVGFPIPNLGFQGTKMARRGGISSPFSDAGGCTSPQNSGTAICTRAQTSAPDRVIDIRIAVTGSVDCDRGRIGQLVSNLVSNAIDHGAPDQPIQVSAATQDGWFELSVTNAGEEIPPRGLIISSSPTRAAPKGRVAND
jgi:hypothetical protein